MLKKHLVTRLIALMCLALPFLLALPVFAYTYQASISVSNNSTVTSYTMLPVWVASNNAWMAANGFMSSTGNDTLIQESGIVRPRMLTSNMSYRN